MALSPQRPVSQRMVSDAQQTEAIQTFKNVANCDDVLARSVLEKSNWSVEAALAVIYDDQPRAVPLETQDGSVPDTPTPEEQESYPPANVFTSRIGLNPARQILTQPLRLLMLPFSVAAALLSSVISLFARLFRIRPNMPSFSLRPLFTSSGTIRLDPYSCSERLVRELEEELGATSTFATTSAIEARLEPIASTSKSGSSIPAARLKLPTFHIGSYESALRTAKEKIVPLCVILISKEHQDTDDFKRTTLRDPDFIKTLQERNFLVWIGDIRYSDSYQTSYILEATTYPFLAFITLQTPRSSFGSSAHSSSAPKMTVFSRIEGPPSTVTSANAIISHINSVFIPRTSSYLDRLKREKATRDAEREMRAEQDRAYEEAGRRDVERIKAKQAQLENEKLAREKLATQEQERAQQNRKTEAWRAWARQNLIPPLPLSSTPIDAKSRLGVKLPDGRRITRQFDKDATLEQVYTWVECEAFPASSPAAAIPLKPTSYTHQFTFSLVTVFPRKVLPNNQLRLRLSEIGELIPAASLAVEGMTLASAESEEEEEEEDD